MSSGEQLMEELEKQIHGESTRDQVSAIDHVGTHARLLAGPGTGKTTTLTRRVLALVLKHGVDPEEILLLTFTRLAAAQLRGEISKVLEPLGKKSPAVSTLHSFALRQILYNSKRVDALPRPIRIADDWEERHIIQEDLKKILNLKEIKEVQKLINQLSTDWETLRVDEGGWEKQFPNAAFLGAWRTHRGIFGETLRAELVYQLKRELDQNREFQLDRAFKHVLIDEYQDLNACDLAVVKALADRKSELFVAGDDDQSIYGFRYAYPFGIRQFPEIYPGTKRLTLEICFRCDKSILTAAEFVARLDAARLPKPTRPRDDADEGTVLLINFKDQYHEAKIIAAKIKSLIEDGGTSPGEIAILLRNDRNGWLSKPIIDGLKNIGVEASLSGDLEFEEDNDYRKVLSILRIINDRNDSLALRSLMQVDTTNGIGEQGLQAPYSIAQREGLRFSEAVYKVVENPALAGRFGGKIKKYVEDLSAKIGEIPEDISLSDLIATVVDKLVANAESATRIKDHFSKTLNEQNPEDLGDFLRVISISSTMIEQETQTDRVNILTMHQAKGLTFNVCFIVGAEDEYIPGKNQGEKEGDERRLLYVSMSRARHTLYITYCSKRIDQQRYSGRNSGVPVRNLSRFLKDAPIKVIKPE